MLRIPWRLGLLLTEILLVPLLPIGPEEAADDEVTTSASPEGITLPSAPMTTFLGMARPGGCCFDCPGGSLAERLSELLRLGIPIPTNACGLWRRVRVVWY